ncbi:MAG TPA: hypothetical protein VGE02_05100 [Gemmatimonadales bacterium]
MLRASLRIQAAYYAATGIWPLVSMRTFELVSGPKVDDWLVRMVGLLAASIGLALWVGARERRPPVAVITLAIASAASFAVIDVVYALADRISPVYLLDAAAEIGILLAVLAGWMRGGRER